MNIVTKVRYQNFLSAGNAPIEVDLAQYPTVLVIGKNGAGKSTLHEAMCFAWFGRPLRKVNKPALVNWINQRDCLVELEWHVANGTRYMVRRGIKPAIFEIYENGVLTPAPANIDDYQSMLENIIKLNRKSFMQVVVLGGTSYVPFMRLAAAARREIIEDLLDIEVFSSMNALAKEDLIEMKSALDKNVTMRNMLAEQVKMAQSFEEQIDQQIKERIDGLDGQIEKTNETIAELVRDRVELVAALVPHEAVKQKKFAASAKVEEFDKTRDKLRGKKAKGDREHAFYKDNDTCPTCEQPITMEFKTNRFADLANTTVTLAGAIDKCDVIIAKYTVVVVARDTSIRSSRPH